MLDFKKWGGSYVAYMTPQNFMFTICLLSSVKNMDSQKKLFY